MAAFLLQHMISCCLAQSLPAQQHSLCPVFAGCHSPDSCHQGWQAEYDQAALDSQALYRQCRETLTFCALLRLSTLLGNTECTKSSRTTCWACLLCYSSSCCSCGSSVLLPCIQALSCLSTRHLPAIISLCVLQDYRHLYTAAMLNQADIVEHLLHIGLDATETREVSCASVFACCIKMPHSWQLCHVRGAAVVTCQLQMSECEAPQCPCV